MHFKSLFFLSSVLLLSIIILPVNATTHYNIEVVDVSEACQKQIQYKIKTDCPTTKDLKIFDTSNQRISGKFIDVNGTITRSKPQVINHYMWYEFSKRPAVCVDCSYPGGLPDTIKHIIIDEKLPSWAERYNVKSNIAVLHSYRYVSEDCTLAVVPSNFTIIADTIYYVNHNCDPRFTDINNTISLSKNDQIPLDFLHNITLKDKAWEKEAKKIS